MPQMLDPNFSRTVVLLAEYGRHGAFGLVVNRRMDEPAHEVVRLEPPTTIREDVHLYVGGPVEPNRAWVLTNHRELDGDALEITSGVYLSAAPEAMSVPIAVTGCGDKNKGTKKVKLVFKHGQLMIMC